MINEPHRHFPSYSVTTSFYEGPIRDPYDNVVQYLSINNPLNFFVKRDSFREKNKYLVYKHFLSPEQFFKYVKIMMTYKGPMWVPHGLKFLYGTHMGPIWALCPDSAHMGPFCPCVLGSWLMCVSVLTPPSVRAGNIVKIRYRYRRSTVLDRAVHSVSYFPFGFLGAG